MISKEKWQQLRQWMQKLGINDDDLEESFILGSGRGGHKLERAALENFKNQSPARESPAKERGGDGEGVSCPRTGGTSIGGGRMSSG